ncbi:MAG: tetratricopeptide repeat protein [Caldilineaceae bacterium]
MTKPAKAIVLYDQLVEALGLVQEPATLGAQSPLAAPYFLGDYLLQQPSALQPTALGRGNALAALLQASMQDLPGQHKDGEWYQRLLEVSFFQPRRKRDGDLWDRLGTSRATYFRDRTKAIQSLETALIRRINPALRAEAPQPPAMFVGRDQDLRDCQAALANQQQVGLAGPSGIGKTTLATQVLAHFAPRPLFWYTFHPGINDQISNLFFALGHFLYRYGASTLWLQLLAEREQLQLEILIGLLRNDLATIGDTEPLFCFDEIDLLQTELEAHTQLLSFLESFPKGFGVLLIGQTIPVITDNHLTLTGLIDTEVRQLVEKADILLTTEQVTQLNTRTKGNPRLIHLYIALHKSGESIESVLLELTTTPSLEALLNRVWRRLSDAERLILQQLAVYRRPAPIDSWPEPTEQAALVQLIERQLVNRDGQGGVTIFLAYRRAIYGNLPPETREKLHAVAAVVRMERQEITAAAYHLLQSGQPAQAVRLWYPRRDVEIDQGQANAAMNVFDQISQNQLREQRDQELLGLIRGEVHKVLGNYTQAQATLRAITWRTPKLSAAAQRLAGDVAELSGELESARFAYQHGLQLVDTLLESELALFHRDLGWIHRRQKSLEDAWEEAQLAQYEVDNLKGHILRDQGDFAQAEAHYQLALTLAEALQNQHGEARTRNALAAVLIKQGRFAEAESHFERAYQLFRRIGKLMSVASVRVNQAVACMLDGRPLDAVPYAEKAKGIFERLQHPYGIAAAYQSLAEAHLAAGALAEAESYSWQVLETEESVAIPDALRTLGEVHLARGNYQEAERYITQSLATAKENQDRYLQAYALRALGKLYLAQDDERAKTYLNEAFTLFTAMGLHTEAVHCHPSPN